MVFIKLIRLHDWLKSLFVLLGSIYARKWSVLLHQGLLAALSFSLIASAVYIFNDSRDLSQDRSHPIKSKRPIAAGLIRLSTAYWIMAACLLLGMTLAYFLSLELMIILSVYLCINWFYNVMAKRIVYLDVACIASGFLLRILAGTVGIGIPVSKWLLLCGTLISLYLALAKRKLEYQLSLGSVTRSVLTQYRFDSLSYSLSVVAIISVVSYGAYCYTMDRYGLASGLMFTLPSCVIAFWRMAYLFELPGNQDNPIELVGRDTWSVINIAVFVLITLGALR